MNLFLLTERVKMKGPPSEESLNVAGCTPGLRDVDYSEYVWMGEEMEEFDSKVVLIVSLFFCFLRYATWSIYSLCSLRSA